VRVHWNTTFEDLRSPSSAGDGKWQVVARAKLPGHAETTAVTDTFSALIASDSGKSAVAQSLGIPYVRADGSDHEPIWELSVVVHFQNLGLDADKQLEGMPRGFTDGEVEGVSKMLYFAGETHYFIMAADVSTLERFGVFRDPSLLVADSDGKSALLCPSNIVPERLKAFAVEMATRYSLVASETEQIWVGRVEYPADTWQHRQIANDPLGRPALWAFWYTRNLRQASIPMVELSGGTLVFFAGDSLREPLWQRGEGVSRGFLGGFDTVWTLSQWAKGLRGAALVEEREKLVALEACLDATSESKVLCPDTRYFLGIEWGFDGKRRRGTYLYTADPATRYLAFAQSQTGAMLKQTRATQFLSEFRGFASILTDVF